MALKTNRWSDKHTDRQTDSAYAIKRDTGVRLKSGAEVLAILTNLVLCMRFVLSAKKRKMGSIPASILVEANSKVGDSCPQQGLPDRQW